MKLPAGNHTLAVTTGGPTQVVAVVGPGGTPVKMGCETFHWSEEDGMYVGDHIPATFDPHADGTFDGYTGTAPNVFHYAGNRS